MALVGPPSADWAVEVVSKPQFFKSKFYLTVLDSSSCANDDIYVICRANPSCRGRCYKQLSYLPAYEDNVAKKGFDGFCHL